MSSLTMALAGFGFTTQGQTPTPGTFNAWLEANNGYTCAAGDCNNLILDAVTRFTNGGVTLIGEITPPPEPVQMRAGLDGGDIIYLAHVRNRTHFVLVTGYPTDGSDSFTVHDPNHPVKVYPYQNISDVIMYYVTPPTAGTAKGHGNLRAAGTGPILAVDKEGVMSVDRDTASFFAPTAADTSIFPASAIIPKTYPLYKQCDPRWGNDLIVTDTLCQVGCLESSTSMAIGGHNIAVGGATSNPGVLNAWLKAHDGYDAGNDMDEDAVTTVNPAHIQWNDTKDKIVTNSLPLTTIHSLLDAGAPVIANVMQGHHFVLVVGWDGKDPDTLYVNDPGFATISYSYSKDVVGWRLFQMEPCSGGAGCM